MDPMYVIMRSETMPLMTLVECLGAGYSQFDFRIMQNFVFYAHDIFYAHEVRGVDYGN